MLTSLVIVSRQPDRSAPRSRHSSFSPGTKPPVVHPLSIQQVTKCSSRNPFALKAIHFDGGVYPLLATPLTTAIPSSVYPIPYLSRAQPRDPLSFRILTHSFALFCTLLHFFARSKNTTLFFSSDSALFGKNTRGWVPRTPNLKSLWRTSILAFDHNNLSGAISSSTANLGGNENCSCSGVNTAEGRIAGVERGDCGGMRIDAAGDANGSVASLVDGSPDAGADTSEKGRAVGGAFLGFDDFDGVAVNIGLDLAP